MNQTELLKKYKKRKNKEVYYLFRAIVRMRKIKELFDGKILS